MAGKYLVRTLLVLLTVGVVISGIRIPVMLIDEYAYLEGYQTAKESENCNGVLIIPEDSLNENSLLFDRISNDEIAVIIKGAVPKHLKDSLRRANGNVIILSDSVGFTFYSDPQVIGYEVDSAVTRSSVWTSLTYANSSPIGQRLVHFQPIYYYGNLESFTTFHSIPSNVSDSVKVILVGYIGDGHTPIEFSGDIRDTFPTPRGEMYSTVLLANIVCALLDGKIFVFQSSGFALLLCLLLLSVNSFALNRLQLTQYGYFRIKVIQLVELSILVLVSLLLLHYELYVLTLNNLAFTIVVIVEAEYWLNWALKKYSLMR